MITRRTSFLRHFVMKQFACIIILLLTPLLGKGAENDQTLVLPRKNEPVQNRYRILTDHYDITAQRVDDAILAGKRLEHLFRVWTMLFDDYVPKIDNKPEQYRHHVVIFRDKGEYNRELLPIEPFIERTNGFYCAKEKTIYCYSTEAKVLFHEGTHQIFEEHFFRGRTPSFRYNFWAVEGIAGFMETLKIEEHSYKVGDIMADKLFAAKKYQFDLRYYMPMRRLTALNRQAIQSNTETIRIYSQSTALVHWLFFAEGGRYRKHLFELLQQAYLDTAKPETLSELTGLSYDELDKKYGEFLKTIPD